MVAKSNPPAAQPEEAPPAPAKVAVGDVVLFTRPNSRHPGPFAAIVTALGEPDRVDLTYFRPGVTPDPARNVPREGSYNSEHADAVWRPR